jgi:hypothetical protein
MAQEKTNMPNVDHDKISHLLELSLSRPPYEMKLPLKQNMFRVRLAMTTSIEVQM